jgi:ribosomal protein S20
MDTTDDNPNGVPEPAKSGGYGNPPEATRFKKGVSGNPKGRPKGSLNVATVFIKTLREKVVINENGRRRTVTKLEAALKQLVNKAASGDIRALRQLLESARDAEAKQNAAAVQNPVIEELDQEVIDGIMQRFNPAEEEGQELQETTQETNDVDDQRG